MQGTQRTWILNPSKARDSGSRVKAKNGGLLQGHNLRAFWAVKGRKRSHVHESSDAIKVCRTKGPHFRLAWSEDGLSVD
jgi:hypothetical protein